ncbi:MAG: helix-turn-helix protein [Conexibacter sp.]|nr:helix-turn-helix protein [Conexibacter sp.]
MAQLSFPFPSDPDSPESEYLTVAEAAVRVHCCERTIRRAIDRGALRAGRVRGANPARGSYRILRQDLDDWLYRDDGA